MFSTTLKTNSTIKVTFNLSSANAFDLDLSKFLCFFFKELTRDKNYALSKLKASAVNKFDIAKMLISVFHRVENIVGKGENAGYQQFLLFPQSFWRFPSKGH